MALNRKKKRANGRVEELTGISPFDGYAPAGRHRKLEGAACQSVP